MRKYFIAVVFLLGLTQNKSEAMNLDGMIMIKEEVEVSNRYKNLACFDNLTKYIKEREKKYENIYGLNKIPDDKIKISTK